MQMTEMPHSREFIGHAAWACTERNRLRAELVGFEAGTKWIGPCDWTNPMNAATRAHITYLRSGIDTLGHMIAACVEAST
jgi:hypothetical protein